MAERSSLALGPETKARFDEVQIAMIRERGTKGVSQEDVLVTLLDAWEQLKDEKIGGPR
jgi:hypothetical protein